MLMSDILTDPELFSAALFELMPQINPAMAELELYEFRYGLDNLYPEAGGWASVILELRETIEGWVNSREFYAGIQIKPRAGGQIVLDQTIERLTRMLLVGLVTGDYPPEWINAHFTFDPRGFFFLHRTAYLTEEARAHLGGAAFRCFEPKQRWFDRLPEVGYRLFREANAEVDDLFMACVQRLVAARGAPILLAIAGPTAAGKTEIVSRLRSALEAGGRSVATVEMDHFLTDRDQREERGTGSLGKDAIHFEMFHRGLADLSAGRPILTPRYNFIDGTSSHDLEGRLKPGRTPITIAPADVIFVEGNFPFLLPEIACLIGIKVVYLTDDAIRLKRKWKRDIDLRHKYDVNYLRNRFFREQFLMAQACYAPQLASCDLYVDTTGAALWVTPEMAAILRDCAGNGAGAITAGAQTTAGQITAP